MDGFTLFGVPPPAARRAKPAATRPQGRPIAAPLPRPAPQLPATPAHDGVLALPSPDWLHHRLTLSGDPNQVAAFQEAARGAGVVPWHFDYDRMEEDWFHLMVAPRPPLKRTISLEGARILARELRDMVWEEHEHALSQIGRAQGCCFDLHQLVPVPPTILRLGPDDPAARRWLWQHWGTTWPLRHVHPTKNGCTFWSADWSPWQALTTIRARWPEVRFELTPAYG